MNKVPAGSHSQTAWSFVVQGRVVDRHSQQGAHGLRVEAWDKDLLVDDFVGRADATDGDGRFSIGFDARHFRGLFGERHPDLFFRVFDGAALLLQTEALLQAVGRDCAVDEAAGQQPATLPGPVVYTVEIVIDAPRSSLAPLHRVHGTLRRPDGCVVARATVRAFGRSASGLRLLGEALTDPSGRYEIRHEAHALGLDGAAAPGLDALWVRAVDATLHDMAGSPECGSPGPDEAIDLVIGPPAQQPPSEGRRAGRFVDGCRIDLPAGDVVERVDYEQIVATSNTLRELRAQWGAAWPAVSDDWWELHADCQLGLHLPFEQAWALLGYQRGRMVKSFSLAPGEDQTIEIYTWDRQKSALESTSTAESEQTSEATGTRRDALDVSQDVARQTGFQMSTGGKVGFSVASVVNVDMNQSLTASNQASERAATASHAIAEATTRSSGKVRSSRTVKVTESREYGSEERVTRKLHNTNAFHTLNVPFFEILASYRVTTSLQSDAVRLVALLPDPNPPAQAAFDRSCVRLHERALRLALLDRELLPGFDAARLLDAYERSCAVLCKPCACPDDPALDSRCWRKVVNCAREMAQAWQETRAWKPMGIDDLGAAAALLAREDVHEVVDGLAPHGVGIDPISIALWEAKGRADFVDLVTDAIRSDIDHQMVQGRFARTDEAAAYIRTYLFRQALARLGDLQSALDSALPDPARAITEAQADVLGLSLATQPAGGLAVLSSDPTLAAEVHAAISAFFFSHSSGFLKIDPMSLLVGTVVCDRLASRVGAKVGGFQNYDVPGLTPLLRAFLSHYQAWDKEQTADEAARQAAAAQVRTDRQERAARVLSAFGLREVVENQERLDALLGHLNEPANRDHYHFAIASERKMLFAASEDALRLVTAGVLEALPVGSLGGRFAVPVRLPAGTAFQAGFEAVRQALARQVLPDAREHVLPTAALYSEAIVGSCNSAEPEALERFRVETQRRTLDNDLQKLEACRLQARLDAQPPLLDKDPAPSPHLDVDLNPATATTPSTS